MGEIQKEKRPVKLIIGLLSSNSDYFEKAIRHLIYDFGDIDKESSEIPFSYTHYYDKEMGGNIIRKWISFIDLIYENDLPEIKLHTNDLEQLYKPEYYEGRVVNIDPGFIALDKLVLATTKNYAHRIYMSEGIYGEVTLNFKKDSGFAPNPWTYPDYKDPKNMEFFNIIREDLKEKYINLGINQKI